MFKHGHRARQIGYWFMSALQLSLMLHGIAQLFGILELGLSKQVPLKKAIADLLKLL